MGKIKTYSANSIVSVRIGSKRFKFTEAGKGSIYRTASKEEQEILEKYSDFGKLYVLSEERESATADSPQKKAVTEKKVVKVTSVPEARDYLVEYHEMTRTSLRNKEAILAAGESVGVTFEGI